MPDCGRRQWPGAGPFAVAAAAVSALALWPSLAALHEVWQRIHDYQHGYVIAAIAVLWFGVVARRTWRYPAKPSFTGSGLLGAALLLWLVAFIANSLMIHQLLVPMVVYAAVLSVAGWRAARAFVVPLAFLYFAMPIWDYGVPVLQRLSVFATETSLGLLGIPAEVREYTVTIPEGTFTIIEGCSGKRYFMVTLAVAVLAGALQHMPPRKLAGFLAASGFLALVANWVRIAIVIYAGHVSDMQHYLVRVEHLTFGNVLFALLLLGVFALARFWDGHRQEAPQEHATPGQVPADARVPRLSAAALPFLLLFADLAWVEARASMWPLRAEIGGLPIATEKWQGPLPAPGAWAPQYVQPDGERRAEYRSPAGSIELYANAYAGQRQNRELIHFANTLLAPGVWKRSWPLETRRIGLTSPALAAFEAHSSDGNRWLIAYTFEVGGWPMTSELLVQLAYGIRSLVRPVPAGVVALATPCDENCESARALVKSFWDDMSGHLLAMVPDEGRKR